jgi:transcriptional regulator with XRE-family HTH domain
MQRMNFSLAQAIYYITMWDRARDGRGIKMKETLEEIGARLRELRELSRVSIDEMAGYLNMPVERYNCYEEGRLDIPASVLIESARRLDVDMGLILTGQEPKMNIFTITRKGEGVDVERRKEYRYQSLAGKFVHKKAEPFIVTIDPGKSRSSSVYSHAGQEFDYVLEGTLKINIRDQAVVLNEGDSIFFDSSYGHVLEALNDRPAKLLAMVM